MERLTDEQSAEAARRYDEGQAMARRFRAPAGMTGDEWEAEVLLVLVQTVARHAGAPGFEALLYMATRWHWLNLARKAKRQRVGQLPAWDLVPARKTAEPTGLDDILHGLSPVPSDVIRLRAAGGNWPTIGRLYGVSGRTAQRWHRTALKRLRSRELVPH